jgi:hypothetical protein
MQLPRAHFSHIKSLALACGLGLLFISGSGIGAAIKCWTNNEGVRECGNVVPPEFAQKGHEEISKSGTVVKEVERAKTAEELARDAELARQRETEARAVEERKKHDEMLLKTFSSTDEIATARKGKFAIIDNEVKISRQHLANAEETLQDFYKKAASYERNGKPIDARLAGNIERAEAQVEKYKTFIVSKEAEKASLKTKFEYDVRRFNELTGRTAGDTPATDAAKTTAPAAPQ